MQSLADRPPMRPHPGACFMLDHLSMAGALMVVLQQAAIDQAARGQCRNTIRWPVGVDALLADALLACGQVAMQQAATDPTTGAIDMDKILTGISATDRTKLDQIASALMSILDGKCIYLVA